MEYRLNYKKKRYLNVITIGALQRRIEHVRGAYDGFVACGNVFAEKLHLCDKDRIRFSFNRCETGQSLGRKSGIAISSQSSQHFGDDLCLCRRAADLLPPDLVPHQTHDLAHGM
jgi:hypothetical protein